jgi:polar amino acid transport system substrate-binding protein
MRNILLLILLSSALVMVIPSQTFAEEKPLRINTENWPPYNYEENGEIKGFSTEIVLSILKELNLNYEIELLPGSRGEKILDEGTRVMNFSLFRTTEREKQYKWIGPIAEDAVYFYKKKSSSLEINTLEDAKKVKRVACRHKGLVHSVLEKEGFPNLDLTTKPDDIIRKVAMGITDLSVSETPLGVQYWLRQANLPTDTLEQTPVKLVKCPLYIACSKDIPDEVI